MKPIVIKPMLVIPMLILAATIFNQVSITNDISFKIVLSILGSFFVYEPIRIIRLKSK
jgi:hypothetical protein